MVKTEWPGRQNDDEGLLVVGHRGTLQPAADLQPSSLQSCSEALSGELPPELEMLLEPWLAVARDQLNQRIPAERRVFCGELVPLESLLLLLTDRVVGVAIQAVAECSLDIEEPLGADTGNALLRTFPLLLRLMRSVVSEWVTSVATFLERLHQDKQIITASLQLTALPPIVTISGTTSEAHAGGHSVLRICFAGGGCLYYKPRPVSGEWLWHALLEAVASVDAELSLPASRVLMNGNRFQYGWVESVHPEENQFFRGGSKKSKDNLSSTMEYWHAAGATLCLAHHAKLTDLHLGNIVATSWGPAVTDAECLATPKLPVRAGAEASSKHTVIPDVMRSIAGTGLLPTRGVTNQPDISGLFGCGGPVSGVKLPAWAVSEDGRYRMTRVPAELASHGNAPLKTTAVTVLPQILSGYRHASEVLLSRRETLIGTGRQWRAVLEKVHAPRVVVRDTLTYGLLLSRSLQPQYLGSSYRRRTAILSGLDTQMFAGLPRSLLRAEARALLQMHIPRLIVLPGSRTLANSSGRIVARGFSAYAPGKEVVSEMEGLSAASLENIQIPALLMNIL